MARSGTPIRLVREDGKLIELNATKIVMSTDRRFGPKSVPFSGSNRVSLDLNLNKAVILIQGFFSDDEMEIGGTKAKATIDFNASENYVYGVNLKYAFASVSNLTDFFATIQNRKLTLKDSDGTDRVLNMVLGNNNTYTSGTQTVAVRTDATPAQIATVVKSGLDATYGSYFTTEIVDGGHAAGGSVTNSMLIITQTSNGTGGNHTYSPAFSSETNGVLSYSPSVTTFAGGTNTTKKSAGDKAQDMYSIMNNSSRSTVESYKRYLKNVAWFGAKTLNVKKGSDYIVGILIPFNSLQTDNNYTPKNFFMPTGLLKKGEKDSTNAMVAGTKLIILQV